MKTEYLYTDLFNMLIEGLRSLEPSEEIAGEAANVLIEMNADIAYLKQQLAEAKKDAERYRWLRNQHWSESEMCVVMHPKRAVKLGENCPSEEYLDAAIDQAMREVE